MRFSFLYISFIIASFLFSCTGQNNSSMANASLEGGTQVYCFKDSCRNLIFSLSLEVPTGEDSASLLIRDSLIADFIQNAKQASIDTESGNGIEPYSGDKADVQAMVDYYGKAGYETLLQQAVDDYEARTSYLENDTTMSPEEKKNIMDEVPQWAFDLNVNKSTDTLGFVVYHSVAYVYYGGAHGGLMGSGALTFDKSTGKKIERFINPTAEKAMQSLIRKGLVKYYAEAGETISESELSERLIIDADIIPLPVNTAYPNERADSLIFTYRQYEIACYADGMPSFMISIDDLMPYLTEEGKALINKE